MLFGQLSLEPIGVAVIALVIAALLFNIKKYFDRPKKSAVRVQNTAAAGPEPLPPRETIRKGSQILAEPSFAGTTKPETVARWEIEFFELTRQMSAQIDTKMAALSALSHDASRICQRMEVMLERLDVALAANREPAKKVNTPPAQPPQTQQPAKRPQPQSQPEPSVLPKLATFTEMDFTKDYEQLASLGAGILGEAEGRNNSFTDSLSAIQARKAESLKRSSISQEVKPQYPNSQEPKFDRTLGDLLMQEKKLEHTATRKSSPPPTEHAVPSIESLFKPVEPRPIGSRPIPQIIPRERVG